MQPLQKLYRKDYTGETLITTMTWENSQWNMVKEDVPNNVINNQISNRAVVLGNGPSRLDLYPQGDLLKMLKDHRGGLLASGAVQTYACNAIYRDYLYDVTRDYTPDFLICSNDMAEELVNSGYCDKNIVYGTSDAVLNYPGKFYLTPQNPPYNAGAVAAYLACFDGHKQVYLIGHDCHSNELFSNYNVYAGSKNYPGFDSPNTERFFILALKMIMSVYSDVEFIRVMPTAEWNIPEDWQYLVNFRQVDFNSFVREIDL